MNIQIIGTKKCKDTQKAIRFFKERNVLFHFVDLNERQLSEGEFNKILQKHNAETLINTNSKKYTTKGFQYMDYNAAEELFENQDMLLTPIIRNGTEIVVGNSPEQWKGWV